MQGKSCRTCSLEKPLTLFHLKKNGIGGRDSSCKSCISLIKKNRLKATKKLKKKTKLDRITLMQIDDSKVKIESSIAEPEEIKASLKLIIEAINRQLTTSTG